MGKKADRRNIRRPSRTAAGGGLQAAGRLREAWFLLPAVVAAVSYFNLVTNGFVYDEIWTLDALAAWRQQPLGAALLQGRGLTYLVHQFDAAIWGQWAGGFHLTNVLLHALASTLAMTAAIALSGSRRAGLLTGILFASQPVHSEAVACFAYRKDVLAMIFTLLSLRLWLMRDRPVIRVAGAICCFGLGLISKEVAVVFLPFMLLAAELLLAPKPSRLSPVHLGRLFIKGLPFLAVAAAAAWYLAPNLLGYFGSDNIRDLMDGKIGTYPGVLLEMAVSAPRIARLFLLPFTLSADYPLPAHAAHAALWAACGILLILIWTGGAVLFARRSPVASFAILWVIVMYLPISNIIPLTRFFAAERYLYVPSFGFCLLLAQGADRAFAWSAGPGRRRIRRLLSVAVTFLVLAGTARCLARGRDWHDGYALWNSARRAGCDSYRVCCNLGYELRRRGELEASIAEYQKAVNLSPRAPKVRLLLGDALEATGRFADAILEYRTALVLHPDFSVAQERLSWMLAACPDRRLRNAPEALSLARRVCERSAYASPRPLLNLAVALAESGEMSEAERMARRAEACADSVHDRELLSQSRAALEQIIGWAGRSPRAGARP